MSVRGAALVAVLCGVAGALVAGLGLDLATGALVATAATILALVPLPPSHRVRLMPLVLAVGLLAAVLVVRDWIVPHVL